MPLAIKLPLSLILILVVIVLRLVRLFIPVIDDVMHVIPRRLRLRQRRPQCRARYPSSVAGELTLVLSG